MGSPSQNGQTNKKSRNCRQVRNTLWCVPQKDGQENRSQPARKIYLQILWQGLYEENGSWNLEMQRMQKDSCWWSLGTKHICSSYSEECYSTSERMEEPFPTITF